MPTLFDMLAGADDGRGLDILARQFNLSRQQAELAAEALLPAFSQGFKQTASDPYGLSAFVGALASGRYADAPSDPGEAVAAGNDLLGQLFGSKDLSRAVAAQAAQATGIGEDILKRMLPVIASMLMGSMFRQTTGQAQSGSFGASNPLGDIIKEMMRQGSSPGGQASAPSAPERGAGPFDNPFGKMLQDMFGGPSAGGSAPPRGGGAEDNPLGKMFEEMFGGGRAAPEPEAVPESEATRPRREAGGARRNPYDEIFGDMFETGRQTREDYQKSVSDIFEQFRRGMDRHR